MDLYQTYEELKKIKQIENDIYNINSDMYNIKYKAYLKFKSIINLLIKICIILAAIIYFYCMYLDFCKYNGFFKKIFAILLYLIITGAITIGIALAWFIISKVLDILIRPIISKIFKNSTTDLETISKLTYNRDSFLKMKEQCENNLGSSIIPRDYRTIDIVQFFINAYENKRANTLKELINLYEYEKESIRRDQQMNEIIENSKQMNRKMDKLNQKVSTLNGKVRYFK